MAFNLLNMIPGPVCSHRSNNPHPKADFLMPKNLVEKDHEQALRDKVGQAVHMYMDKVARSGRDPLKMVGVPQRSRSPTHGAVTMHGHGGKSYMKTAKSYGDAPDEDDFVVRIPANVYNQSRAVRYRVVRQPDAPAEKWVANQGNIPVGSGVKRAHTPPTPPVGGPHHRHRSAALHQQKHLRSKSAPLLDKTAFTEEEEDDAGDWEDVDEGNDAANPGTSLLQRPKTAGPVLARKMLVHPRMKSWIEGATDYEKEVAYNMMRTLSGGRRLPGVAEASQASGRRVNRPKGGTGKPVRAPPATHAYVPPSPAPRKPVPERTGKMDATTKEWMRKVEQKIDQRSHTPVERKYTQKIELRPTVRRQPRPKSLGDYTHENSFFRFSQPSYRRSFVIAPDWVSETLTRRRALKENPSTNKMRYGSA